MSLNDSLFGEENRRWEEYYILLQSQKQKDQKDERLHNTQDIPHPVDQPSGS